MKLTPSGIRFQGAIAAQPGKRQRAASVRRGAACKPDRLVAWFAALALAAAMLAGCHGTSPDDSMAAGDQAVQNNKLPEAEADYQSAISQAPSDPRPHVALGHVYMLEQKADQAELEFMKALDADPKDAAAHDALAGIYSSQSKLNLAEAQYRAAVALDPGQTDYRLHLGTTLQQEGKLQTA